MKIGITAFKVVVQVKWYAKIVQRSVLEALRGSLHHFDAVRKTIVATSESR
ncbi:MAG: restriction endonuclease [Acidobacteriia bacterium]|nr:restriction endonuclease [Terriglobia bacterium]MYG01293.1 restriction endonuclease [Terriglobia bacterium]MYK09234.1 restriction endonuclease [Terriglobia bacterium]